MVKESEPEHSTLRILQQISDLLPKEEQADVRSNDFVDAPINIYASPEEGERLIRAFIRIQQPALLRRHHQTCETNGTHQGLKLPRASQAKAAPNPVRDICHPLRECLDYLRG
jgi:hypothetical protein